MLYMGIDVHKRHLTISIRDKQGTPVCRRQVSTAWTKIAGFLAHIRELAQSHGGGYVAILESCGFHEWLVQRLEQDGCERVIVIAAVELSRRKTDRRDAAKLSELLWTNRDRIACNDRLTGVREVYRPTDAERHDRLLTSLRQQLGKQRTRVKNSVQFVLRRHNMEQDRPTKGAFTLAAVKWMKTLELPAVDRLQLNCLLEQYQLLSMQLEQVEQTIAERVKGDATIARLRTVPRAGAYTALALKAHIGPIDRFPRPRSLANYFGLTPGCRNSGESDRPGHITKAGHPFIRFLLGQMVLHALRRDAGLREWYRQVKQRRGAKIARVAVMRRLAESIWHVLKKDEQYKPVASRVA